LFVDFVFLGYKLKEDEQDGVSIDNSSNEETEEEEEQDHDVWKPTGRQTTGEETF